MAGQLAWVSRIGASGRAAVSTESAETASDGRQTCVTKRTLMVRAVCRAAPHPRNRAHLQLWMPWPGLTYAATTYTAGVVHRGLP